ncbi:MAG TPA: VWA domain-containing protein [Urbifossiella sp.]|jgi:Ca-activated chloride channel family protein|nr:VWA domain-containing protein [Urbifossiella sp.]
MSDARVTVLPSRPAARADGACTLDLLVTVAPPAAVPRADRPPLNLGLVIDRSGSMGEARKLAYAKEAATFAVRELGPADRVSVTVFDDRVETIVPNGVADKSRVAALIAAVTPRGSTALHGGWAEGAAQVKGGLVAGGLNRVLLLSDGLANVGESRPDVIATDVHRRARDGVGTSAVGLGADYNEDLLEAMARSGDGNYYYVESPAQLPALFAAELQGLTATAGTDATLTVESAPGVAFAEVLNDLDTTPDGKYRLPNLVAGMPVYVVVRVTLPGGEGEVPVARFRVEWTPPDGDVRRVAVAGLTLPAVPSAVWDALPERPEVRTQAGLLMAARAKKEATRASEAGDRAGTLRKLAAAREELAACPPCAEVATDFDALERLEALHTEDEGRFRKQAKFEAYQRHRNKPYRPGDKS